MTKEKGLVILYTGEGKGKTTAALGLVLRATGYKRKCLIIQFGKIWFTGEIEGIKKLAPLVKIIQGGKGFVKIMGDKLPLSEHKKAAQETSDLLYKEVIANKWDVVIADEAVGALSAKLIPFSFIKKLIKDKPKNLDLVLTGRHAPEKLIKLVDLATEMVSLKHPYDQGFLAKKGIDY